MLDDSVEGAEFTYSELSGRVDALAAGRAVQFHRYNLPDGHPLCAPAAGHPCDLLEIGADNVVREQRRG
jgi:hypothetical protein